MSAYLGRFGRPADSRQRCGLSRSALYEMSLEDPAIFRKNKGQTLVDFDRVEHNILKLPIAKKQTKEKRGRPRKHAAADHVISST